MSTPKYNPLDKDHTPNDNRSWVPKIIGAFLVVGLAWLIFDGESNGGNQSYRNDTLYNNTKIPANSAEEDDTRYSTDFTISVTRDRPDPQYYTQGLTFIDSNTLIESAGLTGESEIHFIDIKTMKTRSNIRNNKDIFGEGCEVFDQGTKVIQLTWLNRKMYIYEKETLKLIKEVPLPKEVKEGWGVSRRDYPRGQDGKPGKEELYVSDGTDKIHVLDTEFNVLRMIRAYKKRDGKKEYVEKINELEFIEGKLWANVYLTSNVVVIDPDTGYIETIYNMDMLSRLAREKASAKNTYIRSGEVLNGIAYNPIDKKLIITGKKWPVMWEILIPGLNQ